MQIVADHKAKKPKENEQSQLEIFIKTRTMVISFPFTPPSLNTLYPSHNGRRFKSKRYKQFISSFGHYIPEKTESLLHGDLEVEINLYFGDKRRHDIDNFNKAILDTLVEYELIGDDNQITRLHVEKYYDKGNPYTIIEIKSII